MPRNRESIPALMMPALVDLQKYVERCERKVASGQLLSPKEQIDYVQRLRLLRSYLPEKKPSSSSPSFSFHQSLTLRQGQASSRNPNISRGESLAQQQNAQWGPFCQEAFGLTDPAYVQVKVRLEGTSYKIHFQGPDGKRLWRLQEDPTPEDFRKIPMYNSLTLGFFQDKEASQKRQEEQWHMFCQSGFDEERDPDDVHVKVRKKGSVSVIQFSTPAGEPLVPKGITSSQDILEETFHQSSRYKALTLDFFRYKEAEQAAEALWRKNWDEELTRTASSSATPPTSSQDRPRDLLGGALEIARQKGFIR
jgi:hypothetical protein